MIIEIHYIFYTLKKVSLQFPDELLFLSSTIVKVLKEKINEKIPENDIHLYVLADTSYGSCCVDEVAAEHVDSKLIIHYGHSCLSRYVTNLTYIN